MGTLRILDGGQQPYPTVLLLQLKQADYGALLHFTLQFFVIARNETVEILLRVFMIPTAQGGTGRNVFEPEDGGELFLRNPARIKAVDKDGGLSVCGEVAINALYLSRDRKSVV